MSEAPTCITCRSTHMARHHYPPNRFNGKEFHYYKCKDCGSLSIHPLPSDEDFQLIYGPQDHTYLEETDRLTYPFNYPNYDHQKYQVDFFTEDLPLLKGKKLLDYGCGSGFYLEWAERKGFDCTGIEYDDSFAALLRKKTGKRIYSIKEFEANNGNEQYDVIHFGHVLEHLTEPLQAIEWARAFAHQETVWLFDGPLEFNTCLTRWAVETGSRLKNKAYNEHAPQHLSFTTYSSQLNFFEEAGFKTLRYVVKEQFFPFPPAPVWGSPSGMTRYLLSHLSINLSKLFPRQGNIFHYAGTLG